MEQRSAVQDNSFAACSHGGNDRAGSAPDATGLTVRELQPAQLSIWDRFVEQSPQGTIFSESLWLEICGLPFRGFACYKGDVIVGGVAANKRLSEILQSVCKRHNCKFFVSPRQYAGDCGSQISWTGLLESSTKQGVPLEETFVRQSWRLDTVEVAY